MNRAFLVASVVALLPASAFAHIGFKSQAEYGQYLRDQKIGRATEAIRRDPKDAVAYFYRGNIYAESGSPGAPHDGPKYEAALADYDKAIELAPQFAQAYFRRGCVRRMLDGQELEKTPPFKEAARLPLSARHKRLRELENMPRPKDVEVLADMEKAIRLDPKLKAALVYVALRTKDGVKGVQTAKRACALTYYEDDIYLQVLASCYAKSGDFDNAVRWQEKALKVMTFHPASSQVSSAKDRLENYRHQKPNDDDMDFWISVKWGKIAPLPTSAFAYIGSGFKSQTEYERHLRRQRSEIGRATEAIDRNPKDAVAYFYRGNIYAKGGGGTSRPNYESALADYDKAIELRPKFAQAYFRRGQVRLWVHRLVKAENPLKERKTETPFKEADALADLETATQLSPNFFAAQVFFAVSTTDVAKAIEAAKMACRHTYYKNDICLELLASFYAKSGDFDNAVRWQEKAIKLSPTFPEEAKKRLENYRRKKPNEWEIRWDFLTER